jgi:acyl-CoA reductase-like NAD-dependent aldehyde dehydrogenase
MAELVRIELTDEASARAVAARCAAAAGAAALPTYARARILFEAAGAVEREAEAFARLMGEEIRKPLKDARREVARAVANLRLSAEESKRITGEILPMDLDTDSEGRVALVRRVARGPALFITPFNFPLNLVVHKVAPAVAVGLPFVLKPDPRASGTAAKLLEALVGAGWPAEAALLASGPLPAVEALVRDERFRLFSFTGSAATGWKLKAMASRAHVVLELGADSGVFVASDADLPWAAARCAWGAYAYSGQVCVSVQRIYVEKSVHAEFRKLLVQNIEALVRGDVDDEKTDVGPMIDEAAATRVETLLKDAVSRGAKLWAGGARVGAFLPPALIEGVPADSPLCNDEAFGPVAVLAAVDSRERGLDALSGSRYGIQAGIFTNDLAFVRRAFDRLSVGGLIINDVPTARADAAPYGGAQDSGQGREGPRFAIEEYTERRTMLM